MSLPLWSKLKSLVSIDQKISELNNKRDSIQSDINNKELNLKRMQRELLTKEEQIKTLKKDIHLLELDIKTIDEKEKLKKDTLSKVKSQKESDAIEKEIKLLNKERQELEDKLVTIWQDSESLQQEVDNQKKLISETSDRYTQEYTDEKNKIDEISLSLKSAFDEKKDKSTSIPNDWLLQYEKMKDIVEDPIVPLISDSCSHCFFSVLPQDLSRIKRGDLLRCKGCFRLLYHTDD